MSAGLQKLKEKMELQPKYTASQQRILSHPIFAFDLNPYINPNNVVEICKKYKTKKYKEKQTESVYAWRSDYTKVDGNPMVELNSLFDIVCNKVEKITLAPNINYSYNVHHFWFAIYSKGDNSKVHDHGWVDLACVYYAAMPTNSAPLLVLSTGGDIIVSPNVGTLLVMPGNCQHLVPESNHEGDRVIIAMNLIKRELIRSEK